MPPSRLGLAAVLLPLAVAMLPAPAHGPARDELQAELQAIAAAHAALPRDRIDPAAVVVASDGEPARLHAFVRTSTRLVSYAGSLRGAAGTLLDRAGNSVDRALLLAELLRTAGYAARIVQAALPPEQKAEVEQLARTSRPPAGAATPPDAAQVELHARADRISSELRALLPELSAAPPSAELLHHWVQFEDGERWRDADPTLPELDQRRAPSTGDGTPTPPTSHRVGVNLVVERWQDGKLLESPLYASEFAATMTPLHSLALTFLPVQVKQGKASARSFASATELQRLLLKEHAWCPTLLDGPGRGRLGRMFDDAGLVHELPTGLSGAGELGNTARSNFGGLAGSDDDAAPASVLTALFLDFTLRVPDAEPRRVRRPVFDTLGAVARGTARRAPLPRPQWTDAQRLQRGQDLVGKHDALIAFAALPGDVYAHRYGQRVLDARQDLLAIAGGSTDAATFERAATGASMRTLELFAAARAAAGRDDLVVGEPQVYRRILRPLLAAADDSGPGVRCELISDLAWNRLLPPTGAEDSSFAAVRQGVLDTLLERLVVLGDDAEDPGSNTAALFAAAAAAKVDSIVVRAADDARLATLPAGASALLAADLRDGCIAVLPSRPIPVAGVDRLGWWRIDPRTGHTVGAMDTGLLQDTVEYCEMDYSQPVAVARWSRIRVSQQARDYALRIAGNRSNVAPQLWDRLLGLTQRAINLGIPLP